MPQDLFDMRGPVRRSVAFAVSAAMALTAAACSSSSEKSSSPTSVASTTTSARTVKKPSKPARKPTTTTAAPSTVAPPTSPPVTAAPIHVPPPSAPVALPAPTTPPTVAPAPVLRVGVPVCTVVGPDTARWSFGVSDDGGASVTITHVQKIGTTKTWPAVQLTRQTYAPTVRVERVGDQIPGVVGQCNAYN